MSSNNSIIAYALDFVSFFMQKFKEKNMINNIILFGSVARNEAKEDSDVDIFIDIIKENNKLQNEVNKIVSNFYDSAKYKNYWKLLGINNEIKAIIGVLDKWKELKSSIISNGIVLYGKYKSNIKNGSHKSFFIWENIKPNSKRVLFNKQLVGYKQNNKFYLGFLQKYNGEKLGKGCIIVPLEHSNVFHSLFKKYKITVKIKKVQEY